MAATHQPQPGQPLSERNARVASSRKLLRRAHRGKVEQFLAEGPQAVREAVRFHDAAHPHGLDVYVEELFVDAAAIDRFDELLTAARDRRVPIRVATTKAIGGLCESVTPQGIVARCRFLDVPLQAQLRGTPRLFAVPVDVRDPGNAGAIIRCADAAGADGVVLAGDTVDLYNGKTVRASAGSLFHTPISRVTDAAEAIAALRGAGFRIIATEGEASLDLDDVIDDGVLAAPTAWLFGNEARGLPDEVAALADLRVRIPILGLAESLNLSTAAAVCLFASARAQR